jgi:serine/threonine-protein kinase RsbT
MALRRTEKLPVESQDDVVQVRQTVRAWAVELGLSLVEQTKIVTAASELARNTLIHGGGGSVRLEEAVAGGRHGLRLTFEDRGPGIADLQLALKDGYTTGTGFGLGLPGSKRLMNEFQIVSNVGEGTTVSVVRWR